MNTIGASRSELPTLTAPPNANKIQLELWRRILLRRCEQILTLTPEKFHSFVVNGIALEDLVEKGEFNSSHFICQHPSTPGSVTVNDVAQHILALFYRSVDERLGAKERKLGLDLVRKAFSSLDGALEEQETQRSANNSNIIEGGENDEYQYDNNDHATADSGKSKEKGKAPTVHAPTYPPGNQCQRDSNAGINLQEKRTTPLHDSGNAIMQKRSQSSGMGESGLGNKRPRTEPHNTQFRADKTPLAHIPNAANNNQSASKHVGSEPQPVHTPNLANNAGNNLQEKRTAPLHDSGNVIMQERSQSSGRGESEEGNERSRTEPHNTQFRADKTPLAHIPNAANNNQSTSKGVGSGSQTIHTNAPDFASVHSQHLANNKSQHSRKPRDNHHVAGGRNEESTSGHTMPNPMSNHNATAQSTNSRNNGSKVTSIDASKKHSYQTSSSTPNENQGPALNNRKSALEQQQRPKAHLPPPKAHVFMHRLTFSPDNHSPNLASASLQPHDSCTLSYNAGFHPDGRGASLDDKTFVTNVRERLMRWDPYWNIVKEFGSQGFPGAGRKKTKAWKRTASCVPTPDSMKLASNTFENLPKSCAMVLVDMGREQINEGDSIASLGVTWGSQTDAYKTGDRRLILRMLPLKLTDYDKKRSDTHRWPMGTFIQLQQDPTQRVLLLTQRRQQGHDARLWKGLCRPLDLTALISDARCPFGIKICTKEVIEAPKHDLGMHVSKDFEENGKLRPFAGTIASYDAQYSLYKVIYEDGDAEELTYEEVTSLLVEKNAAEEAKQGLLGSYGIHVAVCEYVAPDDLFQQLINAGELKKLSLESSKKVARSYLENQTVQLESDTEDEDCGKPGKVNDISGSLTFSLLCPMSRMPISTPVRGHRCKHMQCFDLKSFLHSNKHISGGRWRCAVCEDFLSVKDLVRCGLFEAMLRDHRDKVSGARDKVSFKSDGTWLLKEENKLRYGAKKRGDGANNASTGVESQGSKGEDGSTKKGPAPEPEVIDLM